jgi:hypothetical protein
LVLVAPERPNRSVWQRSNVARAIVGAIAVVATVVSLAGSAPAADDAASVALILVTLLGVTARSGAPPSPVLRRFDLADGLFALLAIGLTAAVWYGAGVPAFRQDWNVSPNGMVYGHDWWLVLSAWQPHDLGIATPQVGVAPFALVLAGAAFVLGTAPAVALVIGISLALAGWGARRTAVLCGAPVHSAMLAGALYESAPFVFNKLIAGHVSHFWGYALVASAVPLASRLGSHGVVGRRAVVLAAMAIASAVVQPQYAAIVAALIGGSAIVRGRRAAVAAVIAISIALVVSSPTLLGARLSAGDTYLVKRATVEWEYSQSAPPRDLLEQSGYLARYFDERAPWYTHDAMLLIFLLAALGVTQRMTREGRVLWAFGGIAVLAVAGLRGPASVPEAWLFTHLRPLSLFRELYDLEPLFGLAIAVSAALALRRAALVVGAAVLVVLPLALPFANGTIASAIPRYGDAQVVRAIESLPGDSCVFWLPGIYPMRPGAGNGEGYDPYAQLAGVHAAVSAFQPQPAFARAYRARGSRFADAVRGLGCGYVAVDRGAASIAPQARVLLSGLEPGGAVSLGDTISVARLSGVPAKIAAPAVRFRTGPLTPGDPGEVTLSLDDPANARVASELLGQQIRWSLLTASHEYADPRRALVLGVNQWLDFPAYASIPAAAALVGDGVVLDVPAGVLVGALHEGDGTIDHRVVTGRITTGRGAALVGIRNGPEHINRLLVARRDVRIDVNRPRASRFEFCLSAGAPALVLRERWDPGWRLEDRNGRAVGLHFRADGWANAWLGPIPSGCYVARYGPQRMIDVAETLSVVVWLTLCGVYVASRTRLSRRSGGLPTSPGPWASSSSQPWSSSTAGTSRPEI